MSRTITLFLILAICLGLAIGLIALAQEDRTVQEEDTTNQEEIIIAPEEEMEEVVLDETVEAEDLEVEEPRLLPDNPFYFLKSWGRGLRSFFTFNRVRKLELKEKFANEKLIELKKLVEEGKAPGLVKKGIENYQEEVEEIKEAADKIKVKAAESEEVDKFLDKFIKHQLLHQTLLQKLENQVPPEAFEKIREARERHLEKFGEVMTKLEERGEKIGERLETALEEQEGSKFKNFKNLEVLIELEEKVPEQIKEAIRKAQENALKKLTGDLEKMSPEDQERFKEYVEKISGNKETQFEIIENLRKGVEEKPELEEKLKEARQKVIEKIEVKAKPECPTIEKPSPDFCQEGRIVVEKDEKGCIISFKCIIPAEVEILEKPTEPKPVCITLWDPVCGKDGGTYSNACFAKLAGVEIAYKGKCREKECETDADCPQPRCGPAGTISARCLGVRAKCLEGKCVIVSLK